MLASLLVTQGICGLDGFKTPVHDGEFQELSFSVQEIFRRIKIQIFRDTKKSLISIYDSLNPGSSMNPCDYTKKYGK